MYLFLAVEERKALGILTASDSLYLFLNYGLQFPRASYRISNLARSYAQFGKYTLHSR